MIGMISQVKNIPDWIILVKKKYAKALVMDLSLHILCKTALADVVGADAANLQVSTILFHSTFFISNIIPKVVQYNI